MAWIAKKALHISATFYAFSSVLLHLQPDLVPSTIEFLRAFEEDKVSYAPTEDRSFAMMTLLPEYFVNPLRKDFVDVVQQISPKITTAKVEGLFKYLGSLSYALMAYFRLFRVHEEAIKISGNFFSSLQILSAIRNLCALLEVELKMILGIADGEFLGIVTELYKSETWWKSFVQTKDVTVHQAAG